MNLLTGFSTVIGVVNVNDSLLYLRKLFADLNSSFGDNSKNFRTTLVGYSVAEYSNVLDNSEEANKVRAAIELAAINFASACGYSINEYTPVVVNFWLNEMESGSEHKYHSHLATHFSGCIYVDIPKDASGLVLRSHRDRFDYKSINIEQRNIFNSPSWLVNPKEGNLCIWESWIQHGVDKADYEGVRRSAAFDVVMQRKERVTK